MVRVKKKITTKSIGLSKNGKGGERNTTSNSRNVGHRIKLGKGKNKDDVPLSDETREGRSESRSDPGLTQERERKKKSRRTTTVKVALPQSFRKESNDHTISEIEVLTSDECIDLDDLANVEIDVERSDDGHLLNEVAKVDTSISKLSTDSSTIVAEESTQDRKGVDIDFDAAMSKCTDQTKFQSAMESVDAAFYALGKFVGEKTCHDPSLDTCTHISGKDTSPEEKLTNHDSLSNDTELEFGSEKDNQIDEKENNVEIDQSADNGTVTENRSEI